MVMTSPIRPGLLKCGGQAATWTRAPSDRRAAVRSGFEFSPPARVVNVPHGASKARMLSAPPGLKMTRSPTAVAIFRRTPRTPVGPTTSWASWTPRARGSGRSTIPMTTMASASRAAAASPVLSGPGTAIAPSTRALDSSIARGWVTGSRWNQTGWPGRKHSPKAMSRAPFRPASRISEQAFSTVRPRSRRIGAAWMAATRSLSDPSATDRPPDVPCPCRWYTKRPVSKHEARRPAAAFRSVHRPEPAVRRRCEPRRAWLCVGLGPRPARVPGRAAVRAPQSSLRRPDRDAPPAFALAGRQWEDRHDLFRETVEVVRALAHPGASYEGLFARFTNLTVDPAPPEDLEIWFSGTSGAAIRLTLEYATGWFPGRIPLRVFDRLLGRLREGEIALSRTFRVGIMPIVSLDRDRATALARVNVEGLLDEARGKKAWQADGPFETADDLRGMLVAGTTDDVVADLRALAARGVDEVVLDIRQRMDAYEATLDLLAAE